MKNKIITLFGAIALTLSAAAQTNSGTTVAGFIQAIPSYFSAFDTNTTVTSGSRLEIMSDMESASSLGLSGLLGARINITGITTTPQPSFGQFFVVGAMRYAGVGGIITGGEGSIGYSIGKYDTRICIVGTFGYEKTAGNGSGSMFIQPELWLEKASYKIVPGIGIYEPIVFRNSPKASTTPGLKVKLSYPF